jgi:uncharacterized protein YbjT (DUF2867 family)
MFMVAVTRNAHAVEQAIEELKVPYYDLRPDLFVLPYEGTARDLADKLGIRGGEKGSGLVVLIGGYSGRAPSDFWEWLKVNWPKDA